MIIFSILCVSFLMSLLSVYYFDLTYKKINFLIFFAVFSITMTLFTFYSIHFTLLNITLISEILLLIFINKHQFNHETIIISLMMVSAKIISEIIALHAVHLLTHQSIDYILNHYNYLYLVIILTLILLIIIYLNISLFKFKKSIDFQHQNWQEVHILLIIIFTSLSFLQHVFITQQFIDQLILIISLTLLALFIFFLFTYNKIFQVTKENTEYLLSEQRRQYRSINKETLLKASEDMKSLEHRMSYSLLQIKQSILHNDSQTALDTIDQYFHKINQHKSSIYTDNPYFDYILNSKINDLYHKGYTLKITATLHYKPILENHDIIKSLHKIIDYYAMISEDHDLSIECIDKGYFVLFTFTTLTHTSIYDITQTIHKYTPLYSIKNNDNYITCQWLIKDDSDCI